MFHHNLLQDPLILSLKSELLHSDGVDWAVNMHTPDLAVLASMSRPFKHLIAPQSSVRVRGAAWRPKKS